MNSHPARQFVSAGTKGGIIGLMAGIVVILSQVMWPHDTSTAIGTSKQEPSGLHLTGSSNGDAGSIANPFETLAMHHRRFGESDAVLTAIESISDEKERDAASYRVIRAELERHRLMDKALVETVSGKISDPHLKASALAELLTVMYLQIPKDRETEEGKSAFEEYQTALASANAAALQAQNSKLTAVARLRNWGPILWPTTLAAFGFVFSGLISPAITGAGKVIGRAAAESLGLSNVAAEISDRESVPSTDAPAEQTNSV